MNGGFSHRPFSPGICPGTFRNLSEPLHDGSCISCEPGELNIADRFCAAKREANHLSGSDAADTCGGDGNSLPGGDQAQDGEPVRRLLNNLRTKSVLLAQ